MLFTRAPQRRHSCDLLYIFDHLSSAQLAANKLILRPSKRPTEAPAAFVCRLRSHLFAQVERRTSERASFRHHPIVARPKPTSKALIRSQQVDFAADAESGARIKRERARRSSRREPSPTGVRLRFRQIYLPSVLLMKPLDVVFSKRTHFHFMTAPPLRRR